MSVENGAPQERTAVSQHRLEGKEHPRRGSDIEAKTCGSEGRSGNSIPGEGTAWTRPLAVRLAAACLPFPGFSDVPGSRALRRSAPVTSFP